MKDHSRFASAVLSLAILLSTLSIAQMAKAQLPPWTRFTIDNGLEVLVVENHLTPVVTIEIAVKNGSFTEPPEYNGLSHLYEHLFFTANAVDTTEDKFLEKVDDLGIVYNGETHEENVQYFFTLPRENFEKGLDFMSTAITTPLFRSSDLHKQREIVLGEFDRNEALPLFKFGRKFNNALWGEFESRKESLGERPTIKTATHEKMVTIQKRYYVPNNSLLIIAGDVDTATVRKLVPQYFLKWKRGKDPFVENPVPRIPQLNGCTFVIDTVDQPRVDVKIDWHGPSIGDDDKGTYVADVFNYIITQQEHRFTKGLEESGLAEAVNFWYYTQRYVGPIDADIVTTPDHVYDAMKYFWSEVNKFDDSDYFTDEEFETAKNVIRVQILYKSEQLSTFSQDLAFWWASAGLDYYKTYLANLSHITRQDIKDYVRRYLKNKPYVLGVALSKEAAGSLKLDPKKLSNPQFPLP